MRPPSPRSLLRIILCCSFAFVACIEVASDRGVVYDSPDRVERTGTRELLVTAQVLNQHGHAIPGVTIAAETVRGKDSGITNSSGKALLHVELAHEERVDFFFSGAAKGSVTVETLPAGLDALSIIFSMDRSGKLRVSQTEY